MNRLRHPRHGAYLSARYPAEDIAKWTVGLLKKQQVYFDAYASGLSEQNDAGKAESTAAKLLRDVMVLRLLPQRHAARPEQPHENPATLGRQALTGAVRKNTGRVRGRWVGSRRSCRYRSWSLLMVWGYCLVLLPLKPDREHCLRTAKNTFTEVDPNGWTV